MSEHDGGRIGCNHAGGICSETPDGAWHPPLDVREQANAWHAARYGKSGGVMNACDTCGDTYNVEVGADGVGRMTYDPCPDCTEPLLMTEADRG